MADFDDEVSLKSELERKAVKKFLERQARGRAFKQQRNTELRPSAHRYSSPAKPGFLSTKSRSYADLYQKPRKANGWNASTQLYQPPPRPPSARSRFAPDLAQRYEQNVALRRKIALDKAVVIDDDFRPEIAKVLKGFKTRCRNRSRDRTIQEIWKDIETDAPPVEAEEDHDAEEEERRKFAETNNIGFRKWIRRQRAARREHNRVARQTALRSSDSENVRPHH